MYGGYFSRWTSLIIKIFIGRRLHASSQLTSLRGVVCQIRFKTDLLSQNCCSRQKNRVLDSSILWIFAPSAAAPRTLSCSAMPGAQRARRRGRLRDRGSPPGQPGDSGLLKIIKKPDCHLKYWFLTVKQAAHMTDVCLGPLAHGVAPFLRFSS